MADLTTNKRKMLKGVSWRFGSKAWCLVLMFIINTTWPPLARADENENPPKPSYRLGVFPYLPALTIDRLYSPVAEAFSFELDRLVKLRTKTTFESFEAAMASQSYDIIFVHPFFLIDAIDHHSYVPMARIDKPLHAILAVKNDSPAASLNDLMGKTIGLPPKLAAVSDLIKTALIDADLRPGLDIGIRHFRNKASCVQAVILGGVAACGLPSFVLSQIEEFGKQPLRVVFQAPPVNHFAFAVHERVPESERQKLKDLVLSWSDRDHEIIQMMGLSQGFVQAVPHDYAAIRAHKARLQTFASR